MEPTLIKQQKKLELENQLSFLEKKVAKTTTELENLNKAKSAFTIDQTHTSSVGLSKLTIAELEKKRDILVQEIEALNRSKSIAAAPSPSTISAEVALLEKRKKLLEDGLGSLQKSYVLQRKTLNSEIELKTKEKQELEKQVKELRTTVETYGKEFSQSQESIETFNKDEFTEGKSEADTILANAKEVETRAIAREETSKAGEKLLIARENKAHELEELNKITDSVLLARENRLSNNELEALKKEKLQKEKLDKTSREVFVLEKRVDVAKTALSDAEVAAEAATKEASERLNKAKIEENRVDGLVKEYLEKIAFATKTQKENEAEAKRLSDQRATFDRAVREYRAKGVKI